MVSSRGTKFSIHTNLRKGSYAKELVFFIGKEGLSLREVSNNNQNEALLLQGITNCTEYEFKK